MIEFYSTPLIHQDNTNMIRKGTFVMVDISLNFFIRILLFLDNILDLLYECIDICTLFLIILSYMFIYALNKFFILSNI